MLPAALSLVTCLVAQPSTGADAAGVDFFETKIRPVLVERCYPCHSAGAEKLQGGLRLDTRDGVLMGGVSGPAIVPGDVERSRLVRAVRRTDEDLAMPPATPLTAEQVADFEAWVRLGAPDPRTGPAVAGVDLAAAARHWAFRPPAERPVPDLERREHRERLRTPVDAFVLAALETRGMRPSPDADRRTLLRRATYDLTGLPPAAGEIDAFLADDAPDAYERVLDRLLASPRHGERWGRHWLDVARYADTKGYVYEGREEARFVHSATYRDWVIGALNEDLPYDRFLLEQIAGDQVREGEDPRPLAAMGFLTVGRRFINNPHDIIDDRIDTLCRATMALTVGCARCHDHKYDPVPMADYYSLYGVFAGSTERMAAIGRPAGSDEAVEAYEKGIREREKAFRDYFEEATAKLLEALRAQTPAYLAAVLEVEKLPTEEFYQILSGDDLRPFIVRRWHQHLLRLKEGVDPIFGAWHAFDAIAEGELAARAPLWLAEHGAEMNARVLEAFESAAPPSMREVADRYGGLFAEVLARWKEAEKAGAATLPDPAEEELRQVLYGTDSPIARPKGAFNEVEWFYAEKDRVELGKRWREIERWILESGAAPPHAVYLEDRDVQRTPRVLRRGNPANPGEAVPRRTLFVLGGADREPFEHGSGRLELARSIASAENPLTARVIVNRIWMHHFGEGLVATPSDFGLRGDPPSHPELLDWLAARFVGDGWSLKALHRLLMLSSTYRQSSADVPDLRAADPKNRLLWRMPRRRLDFEEMRDSFLAAAGALDLRIGGRPEELTAAPFPTRRSVYGFIDRLNIPGVFRAFDVAGPDQHAPRRHETTVPQQALFLMNGPFLIEQSRALAARLQATEPTARVRALYRIVFGRAPSERELALGVAYTDVPGGPPLARPPSRWRYGYGEVDESTGMVAEFHPLPHFTGSAWQGGSRWPDPALGWVMIDARGGHVGNDLAHAAIRRWAAPRDCTVSISGAVSHAHEEGDGIRARIISSRAGTLGAWRLHDLEAEAAVAGLEVKAGDIVDFVVDCGSAGDIGWDEFAWAPIVRAEGAGAAGEGAAGEWSAAAQFEGPPRARLDAWERYAQTLLLTNEFLFLD